MTTELVIGKARSGHRDTRYGRLKWWDTRVVILLFVLSYFLVSPFIPSVSEEHHPDLDKPELHEPRVTVTASSNYISISNPAIVNGLIRVNNQSSTTIDATVKTQNGTLLDEVSGVIPGGYFSFMEPSEPITITASAH